MNRRIVVAIGVAGAVAVGGLGYLAVNTHASPVAGRSPATAPIAIASPTRAGTVGSAGPAAVASPSGVSGGAKTSPATAETTARCTASDLTLAQLPGSDGAAGTVIIAVALTNKSAETCSMTGYPSFTATSDASGGGGPTFTIVEGAAAPAVFALVPSPVTVGPSSTAGFLIKYSNRPAAGTSDCATTSAVKLSTDTGPVTGPVRLPLCGAPLTVSPFLSPARLASAWPTP
jgi:hypothetical protein